jgi:hypothetical protein
MGNETVASGLLSTAMGSKTAADGIGATSMGLGTKANGRGMLAVGQCNSTDDVLFVVGNGDYSFSSPKCGQNGADRDDAFTVDASGSATASSHDAFSDRRLKTEVESLRDGILQKLNRLRPVRYQFKEQRDTDGEQLGLIAQDVRKEFPQLVSTGPNGMLSLAYPKLTAVLVKGIQEQQTTIDSLKQKVRSLQEVKQQQERLVDQVAALQHRRSDALPAGWGAPALMALLLGLGGFGIGFFWRRSA